VAVLNGAKLRLKVTMTSSKVKKIRDVGIETVRTRRKWSEGIAVNLDKSALTPKYIVGTTTMGH